MFDIGFWELTLIGVVALLVVGPDRLPGLARTVGLWVGRIRRYVSSVRDDIEREVRADELKQMLAKTNNLNPLQDIVDETKNTIGSAKQELAGAEKEAQELMSDESSQASGVSESDDSDYDETGADPVTPDAAATAIGEKVSSQSEATAKADDGPPPVSVENSEDDERRSS